MRLVELQRFGREIEKAASLPSSLGRLAREHPSIASALARAGQHAASGAGGAAIGATLGAAGGAANNPDGRIRGALRGAATGAVAGGLAGMGAGAIRDARLLNPGMGVGGAVKQVARDAGTGLVNFGKRTVHGLTGHFDPDAIGMAGRRSADKQVQLLQARHNAIAPHLSSSGLADAKGQLQGNIQAARDAGEAGERARRLGVTNLPGLARGLANKSTRGDVVRELGHQVTGGKLMSFGGAVGVGVPAALAASDLAHGDESAAGGRTVGQKLRSHAANIGVGALTAGLPMGSQFLAGSLTDVATSPRRRGE